MDVSATFSLTSGGASTLASASTLTLQSSGAMILNALSTVLFIIFFYPLLIGSSFVQTLSLGPSASSVTIGAATTTSTVVQSPVEYHVCVCINIFSLPIGRVCS